MSISRVDVPLLSQLLFPLITPGFTFVAWTLLVRKRMRAQDGHGTLAWLPPALGGIAAFALALALPRPDRTWVFVPIGISTMANVAPAALLIHSALERRNRLAAGLFALNLIITFALSGIAGMPNKPLEAHWGEQIISTISNLQRRLCLGGLDARAFPNCRASTPPDLITDARYPSDRSTRGDTSWQA